MMKKIIYFLILLSLAFPCVHGYGIASGYLENNTMLLSPGESREHIIELQNSDNIPLKMNFFLDSDIASVIDPQEYYLVGNMTPIRQITVLIKIPEDAKPGDEYVIKYWTTPFSDSNKSINLNIQLSNSFKVLVKEPEENPEKKKFYLPNLLIPVSIGIIFIFILVILFRKNRLLSKKIFRK